MIIPQNLMLMTTIISPIDFGKTTDKLVGGAMKLDKKAMGKFVSLTLFQLIWEWIF